MTGAARSRFLAAALLALALLVGVAGGVVIDRAFLLPARGDGHTGPRAEGRPDGAGMSGRMRGRFLHQLTEDLKLSADQRRRVDSLLSAQQESTRAIMRERRPRFEAARRGTEAGLRAILTAEQWRRFEETRAERVRRRGHGRPGPPERGDTGGS